MAAIDKCYVSKYEDYKSFVNWAQGKSFTTPRGCKVNIADCIYEWNEAAFDGTERPIFNTPTYVDNYLFHNCSLPFIQEWLKSAYTGNESCKGYPSQIAEELAIPPCKPCKMVRIERKIANVSNKSSKCRYWIVEVECNGKLLNCNEQRNYWLLPLENDEHTGNQAVFHCSLRSIIRRIIKSWKLPAECTITLSNTFGDEIVSLKTY